MTAITTWMKEERRDLEMNEYHEQYWSSFIKRIADKDDLKDKTVLDFGCGCGGFLRMLFDQRKFKSGVGIDIADKSLETATSLVEKRPIKYLRAENATEFKGNVDFAFSYEVIYLMQDLKEHAEFMSSFLKPGGVYYAATGCHTGNPQWFDWKKIILNESVLPLKDYAPDDFVDAFKEMGYKVGVCRLDHRDFVSVVHEDYFPTAEDAIRYYADDIKVFRFEKLK